jgi:hypothetical protein
MPDDKAAALMRELDARLRELAGTQEFCVDNEALQKLDVGLFESVFLDGLPANMAPRAAAHKALSACIEFINSFEEWRGAKVAGPLVDLAAALRDLDDGYVDPMLRPRALPGRGRRPSRYLAELHGIAAGIVGGLMKNGSVSEAEAAKWLAEKFAKAGVAHVQATALIEWRKQSLNPKNKVMRERYYKVLQHSSWDDPRARAEQLLTALIPSLRHRKGK